MDLFSSLAAYTQISEVKKEIENIASKAYRLYENEKSYFDSLKPAYMKKMSHLRAIIEVMGLVLFPSSWSNKGQFVQTFTFMVRCFYISIIATIAGVYIKYLVLDLIRRSTNQTNLISGNRSVPVLDCSINIVKKIDLTNSNQNIRNTNSSTDNPGLESTTNSSVEENSSNTRSIPDNTDQAGLQNTQMVLRQSSNGTSGSSNQNNRRRSRPSFTYALLNEYIEHSVVVSEYGSSNVIHHRFKEDDICRLNQILDKEEIFDVQENAEYYSSYKNVSRDASNIQTTANNESSPLQERLISSQSSETIPESSTRKSMFKRGFLRRHLKRLFANKQLSIEVPKKSSLFDKVTIKQLFSFLVYLAFYVFFVKFFWLSEIYFKVDFTSNSIFKNTKQAAALAFCFFLALIPFYKNTFKSHKILAFNLSLFFYYLFKETPCISFSDISTFWELVNWAVIKYAYYSTIVSLAFCPYIFEHNLLGFKTVHLNTCKNVCSDFKKSLFPCLAKLCIPNDNILISESDTEILKSFKWHGSRYIVVPRKLLQGDLLVLQYNIISKIVYDMLKQYNILLVMDIIQCLFFSFFYAAGLYNFNISEVLALQLVSYMILLCFSMIRNRILYEMAVTRHHVISTKFPELIKKIKKSKKLNGMDNRHYFEALIVENLENKEYSLFTAFMVIPKICKMICSSS